MALVRGHNRDASFKPEVCVKEDQVPIQYAVALLLQDILLRMTDMLESLTHCDSTTCTFSIS